MKRTLKVMAISIGLVGIFALSAEAAPTYIGAAKCKMCHKLQFDTWTSIGTHSKALEIAKACDKRKFDATCLTCHSTNKSETVTGVECEGCHGPGSDYKTIPVMKDRTKSAAAGLTIPTQATCVGCHDSKDHHKAVDIKTAVVHEHKAKK